MDEETDSFSYHIIKLLITTRLDMEAAFQEGRKKKSFLWGKILQIMKETMPDLKMTREQICRKYLNLFTTYRRIRNRCNSTGRLTTSWEFYDQFDEVYGSKYSSPPAENFQSSLSYCSTVLSDNSLHESSLTPQTPPPDEHYSRSSKRRKLSDDNEILAFLKKEAQKEEERHIEVVQLERQKIAIERERIKAMNSLKDILQKLIEK